MIAGKTYSNSMLYTLNARSSMRHRSNIHNTTGIVGNVRKTMTMTDLVFTNPALREGSDATKTVDRPVHCSIGRTNSQRAVVGDHETHIIVDEVSKTTRLMISLLDFLFSLWFKLCFACTTSLIGCFLCSFYHLNAFAYYHYINSSGPLDCKKFTPFLVLRVSTLKIIPTMTLRIRRRQRSKTEILYVMLLPDKCLLASLFVFLTGTCLVTGDCINLEFSADPISAIATSATLRAFSELG